MWIVKVNNYEIVLPQGDNVFLCSVQNNTEMKSTDFDYYYDDAFLIALEIKGILEEVDGIRYVLHDYDGQLYNPLVTNDTFDCTLTINNISLTKKRVNMTVTANTSALGERYNKLYYLWRELNVPNVTDRTLWGLWADQIQSPRPQIVWSGYHFTGLNSSTQMITDDTKICGGNLPIIYGNEYTTMIQNFGYNLVNTPTYAPYLQPNTLYADGDIKMRRGRVYINTLFDINADGPLLQTGKCACVKGDYAGIYDDSLRTIYYKTFNDLNLDSGYVTFSVINSFKVESECRKTRIYYSFSTTTSVSDLYVASTSPFNMQWRTRGGITSTTPAFFNNVTNLYEVNPSTAGYEDWGNYRNRDSFVEFLPASGSYFSQDTTFVLKFYFEFNSSTSGDGVTFDFQQHWDDNYRGYKKIVGNDGDTTATNEYYSAPTWDPSHPVSIIQMNTLHFDSRAWGCNIQSDYNGSMVTGFTSDTGYNEPFYNVASGVFCPLMYTDKHLCLDATVYDILWNFAYLNKSNFSINKQTKTIDFANIVIHKIDEYIVDEEITFNNESIYWENKSEKKYYVYKTSEDEEGYSFYKSDNISLSQSNTAVILWDANGDYGAGDTISRCALPLKFSDNESSLDKEQTILHSARRILSGASSLPLMSRNMYVMQFNGSGFFMYFPEPTEFQPVILNDNTIKPSLISHPPTMKIKIPELLDTFYVTIQNRTFWVKSQEVGDDGVNEVELLLYC